MDRACGTLGFSLPLAGARQGLPLRIDCRLELFQPHFDFTIASEDLLPVSLIHGTRLRQNEQVLTQPVAHQRLANRRLVGLDGRLAQFCQLIGIAFASQDRVNNRQPSDTSDIADDVVQLQIHLNHRLLHVLHMLAGSRHHFRTMPPDRSNGANRVRWPEGGT